MLFILSPAKTLDFEVENWGPAESPALLEQSKELVGQLRDYSAKDLQSLMGISAELADLNYERYQSFETPFKPSNAKPAILAFQGDVYKGMEAESFSEKERSYAREHIRILSGLYGILRPFDLMQPYRLEMGTKLENEKGKNLYEFWGDRITQELNKALAQLDEKIIINVASKEYFKAVKPKALDGKVVEVQFKEWRPEKEKYRVIAFYAKKARGAICRYAAKHQVHTVEELKGFDYDNYAYNESLSKKNTLVFTR